MVYLPELNDNQRLFLKTIFDYFHNEGKWPTYLWVENTIRKMYPARWPNFDMVEVSKSLPDGFATAFGLHRNYEHEAGFIAPALYYFREAKVEIADFIRVVRFCVDLINTSDEARPEISSEDLSSRLDMQPLAIRQMYLLLQWEPNIMGGSGANEEWWRIYLQRGKDGVRRFEGVESFEQYLEKRTPLMPKPFYMSGFDVQPAQREPANDELKATVSNVELRGVQANDELQGTQANVVPALDMGLIGTQYHIVQGDQYNISGTSGNVKVKSPSIDVATSKIDHRNPWASGSFYLIVLIVAIVALSVAGHVLSIYALPIVIIGSLLALSIIGALQLRQDDRLSEENFLKLMALSFKYLPWLKRGAVETGKNSPS